MLQARHRRAVLERSRFRSPQHRLAILIRVTTMLMLSWL